MNTKREILSKKRQKARQELDLWSKKRVEVLHLLSVTPGAVTTEQLKFCYEQLKRCQKELINLNKMCPLQQKWVKG